MGPPDPPTYPTGTPYVLPADLPQYAPCAVVGLGTVTEQEQACLGATETADSYLRGRYGNGTGQPFIISAWGNDVQRMTAYIAIFMLLSGSVGFAPQAGSDTNIVHNYYTAVGWPDKPGSGWFPGVQSQRIHPDITPMIPIGQNPNADVPQVITSLARGWGTPRGMVPRVG